MSTRGKKAARRLRHVIGHHIIVPEGNPWKEDCKMKFLLNLVPVCLTGVLYLAVKWIASFFLGDGGMQPSKHIRPF